jgi:molecular chaperone DnaK (HSP70)
LSEAKLTKESLSEVEILGGSSRINIIKRTLSEILGLDASAMNYGLKTTMNADEAVARGGALQCAMLSSRMKVKPFNIVDKIPYGIVAHFEGSTAVSSADNEASGDSEQSKGTSVSLYSRNGDLPHKPRRLTFHNKSSDFTITVAYDDAAVSILPPGESRFLGRYKIKVPPTAPQINDIRVTWNLDKNGFVYVQSAQLLEEVKLTAEEEQQAAEKEAKEKDAKEESTGTKKRFKKTDLEVG